MHSEPENGVHEMIVYKYYGYKAGLAALRSRKLGFRCPNYFNDPFELSFPVEESDLSGQQLNQTLKVLRKWVVILSLTETPMDPLMWAHYGDEHKGFAIGYDVSCPFLNSVKYNLITANEGLVTYARATGPEITSAYNDSAVLSLLHLSLGAPPDKTSLDAVRSLARKAFLTKHPRWSNEREVRVIKVLTSAFETVSDYQADPLRSFSIPSHLVAPETACSLIPGLYLYDHQMQIKEVYLGARNPLIERPDHNDVVVDRSLAESAVEHNWSVRRIYISASSWDLDAVDLAPDSLLLAPRRRGLTYSSSFDADIARFLRDRLPSRSISDHDQFEVTRWNGTPYLNKNGEFI